MQVHDYISQKTKSIQLSHSVDPASNVCSGLGSLGDILQDKAPSSLIESTTIFKSVIRGRRCLLFPYLPEVPLSLARLKIGVPGIYRWKAIYLDVLY